MHTHADKTQKNKSQAVANAAYQKQSGDESTRKPNAAANSLVADAFAGTIVYFIAGWLVFEGLLLITTYGQQH